MSEIYEIQRAIKTIERYHKKIIILHCVSSYPTKLKETNLKRINFLKRKFRNYKIGLSDHTNNIFSSIAAIPLEVCAIEKHFNFDNLKTHDSLFSINPNMLKKLKELSLDIFESLKIDKKKQDLKKNIKFRRSIYAKKNIKKNQKITKKNIVSLRPLVGIGSENFFSIIHKKAKKNINAGSPIYFRDLKK